MDTRSKAGSTGSVFQTVPGMEMHQPAILLSTATEHRNIYYADKTANKHSTYMYCTLLGLIATYF